MPVLGNTVFRTIENTANLVSSGGICQQYLLTILVTPIVFLGHSLVTDIEEVEAILKLDTTTNHLGHLELSVDVLDNVLRRVTVVELMVKHHHVLPQVLIFLSLLTKLGTTGTLTHKHEVVQKEILSVFSI